MENVNGYFGANLNAHFPTIGTEAWAETLRFAPDEQPNDAEIALALSAPPFSIIVALKINKNAEVALEKTNQVWGNSGLPMLNHKPDAFRHAYWLAINTTDVGNNWAYEFSEAHEAEVVPALILEKQMDQFNNGVGILKGVLYSYFSDDEMVNCIYFALLNGELRYISPLDFTLSSLYPVGLNGILPSSILIPTNQ